MNDTRTTANVIPRISLILLGTWGVNRAQEADADVAQEEDPRRPKWPLPATDFFGRLGTL
jgi:hypothetical protein